MNNSICYLISTPVTNLSDNVGNYMLVGDELYYSKVI